MNSSDAVRFCDPPLPTSPPPHIHICISSALCTLPAPMDRRKRCPWPVFQCFQNVWRSSDILDVFDCCLVALACISQLCVYLCICMYSYIYVHVYEHVQCFRNLWWISNFWDLTVVLFWLSTFMYTCMCISMHTYMYVYVQCFQNSWRISEFLDVSRQWSLLNLIFDYVFACLIVVCVHFYTSIYIYVYIYIHTCICIYIHIYIHT